MALRPPACTQASKQELNQKAGKEAIIKYCAIALATAVTVAYRSSSSSSGLALAFFSWLTEKPQATKSDPVSIL